MAAVVSQDEQPISRTYQYRKVMKPMLERKRRARINRCLDELKELLVGALQAEGESVSRLEKADVLELTVRHLHKLRRAQQLSDSSAGDRFRAGFSHCAAEVSKYMSGLTSSIDLSVSSRLVTHLDHCIHHIDAQTTAPAYPSPTGLNVLTNYTPPSSPIASPGNPGINPKLFAYMTSADLRHHSPSPAHLQGPFGIHGHTQQQHQQPLSLCTKSSDEPFDLSNGSVWRPW